MPYDPARPESVIIVPIRSYIQLCYALSTSFVSELALWLAWHSNGEDTYCVTMDLDIGPCHGIAVDGRVRDYSVMISG